jgi:hypothetical protein
MTHVRVLAPLVLAAFAAAAAPAWAGEPEAVSTAAPSGAGAPPTVAEQIDAYLNTSPLVLPAQGASGVTPGTEQPRKIHGVVDVAVGTGGYRSAYVRTDLPVGKTGTLSIAVQDTRLGSHFANRYGGEFGGYGRQSPGLGLALGDAAQGSGDLRCRQARGIGGLTSDIAAADGQRSRACALPSQP